MATRSLQCLRATSPTIAAPVSVAKVTYSYVATVEQTWQVSKIMTCSFGASLPAASEPCGVGVQVLNDVTAVPVDCDCQVITAWCQRKERALPGFPWTRDTRWKEVTTLVEF